jgi:hypothetical protein
VVRQVLGQLVEGLVNCLVVILADFFGLFIDEVYRRISSRSYTWHSRLISSPDFTLVADKGQGVR